MTRIKKKKIKKGFTLVELLAVIAIIAVIATSAIVGVNYVINKQKENLANIAEEHIKEAALTYFGNKKSIYVEACKDTDGDYTSLSQSVIKRINDDLRTQMKNQNKTTEKQKYDFAKSYVTNINTNEGQKQSFNNSYIYISNYSCYKLITVGELIDAGLLEDRNNMCNKASLVLVYQKGDTKNTAGKAEAIQEPQICNGSKRKQNPPSITVTPDKDTTRTVGKTINIAIIDENRALNNTINLKYAWSTNANSVPTSGWKSLSVTTNKKKGTKDIYIEGLKGNNYLWVQSNGTIDSYNNSISPFASGPYNFLALVNVKYDDNTGTGCSTKTKVVAETYKYGEDKKHNSAPLCEPSKTGYSFNGWDLDGANINNNTTVTKTTEHTLKAKWGANSYTVTYDSKNGDACNPATKSVTFDAKYGTLCTTTRTGYTFKKWTKDGTNTEITADSKVSTASNHKLNANWEANTYTITYKDTIGSGCNNVTKSVTYDSNYGTLCSPTSTSHNFDGWYLGSTKITSSTKITTANNHDLIAKWTLKTYNLSFNGNTNTGGSTATVICQHNVDCTIPANGFTKTNYGFTGWATSENGSVVYYPGNKIKITANTTLFAKWLGDQFTISYNGNSSTSGSMSNTVCRYGENCSLTNNGFSKTNYTFAGWATSSTGNVAYANGANMKDAGNKTLYAKWNGNPYVISFSGNGSNSGSTAAKNCNYGVPCTLTTNGFSRTNYTFTGWATSSTGNVAYANRASVTDLGTTTLYAHWRQNAIRQVYSGTYSGSSSSTTVTFTVNNYYAANGVTATTITNNGRLGRCTYSGNTMSCPISGISGTAATSDQQCAYANGKTTTDTFFYRGNCYVHTGHSPGFNGNGFTCGSRTSPHIPGSSNHCPAQASNGHVHCTTGNNCVQAEKHRISNPNYKYVCWCWSKGAYVNHTVYTTSYTLVYYVTG